ncbi:MAG: hypothetical protein ACRDZP_04015, partial [Acidimicrobiales bacterium]
MTSNLELRIREGLRTAANEASAAPWSFSPTVAREGRPRLLRAGTTVRIVAVAASIALVIGVVGFITAGRGPGRDLRPASGTPRAMGVAGMPPAAYVGHVLLVAVSALVYDAVSPVTGRVLKTIHVHLPSSFHSDGNADGPPVASVGDRYFYVAYGSERSGLSTTFAISLETGVAHALRGIHTDDASPLSESADGRYLALRETIWSKGRPPGTQTLEVLDLSDHRSVSLNPALGRIAPRSIDYFVTAWSSESDLLAVVLHCLNCKESSLALFSA